MSCLVDELSRFLVVGGMGGGAEAGTIKKGMGKASLVNNHFII